MNRSISPSDGGARLRVGVVGCGLIAQVMHLPNLRALDDRFEVVAFCDVAPQPLEFAHRMFPSARAHTAWEDLLAESLDAVLVLTPGSHAPIAVAAARAGLHVFTEKPMCFSVAEGEAMLEAASAAGVVLMVGYMKRYDPSYEELQLTLDRDAVSFARVTTLESPIESYAQHHPLGAPPAVDPEVAAQLAADKERRLDAALGRSDPYLRRLYHAILLDSMVHELNAVRGLLGEPTALHAARVWGAPSGLTLTASFGPVEAAFMWVDLPGIGRYAQELAFYGPDRRASLGFPSPLLHSHPTQLVVEGGEPGGVRSWRTEHTVSYEEAFVRELVEFHAAVSEGRAPRTDGADALRDVALAQSIVRAHLEGRAIEHPSDPGAVPEAARGVAA